MGLKAFTFHNVSINSPFDKRKNISRVLFTFHNVSINSKSSEELH